MKNVCPASTAFSNWLSCGEEKKDQIKVNISKPGSVLGLKVTVHIDDIKPPSQRAGG